MFVSPKYCRKGRLAMKKILSLVVVAAAFAASVGCDDKKTTGGAVKPSGASSGSATGSGTGSASK